jgi:hypothetical protein
MMKKVVFFICILSQFAWAQTENKQAIPKENKTTESNPSESSSTKSSEGWVFGVGVAQSYNSKLSFFETKINHGSNLGKSEFSSKNFSAIDIEARKLNPNSWGFIGGLSHDIGKNWIETGTLNSDSGKTDLRVASNPVSLQTVVLYANAAYRLNQFYFPFGLNVAYQKYSKHSDDDIQTHIGGQGYGVQFGIGYYLEEKFILEAYARSVGLNISSTSENASYPFIDLNDGMIANFMIAAKYLF